ncbi:transcriptional regulator [uncultured Campylobacter sp.]|uniref:transcriptional regulator n=1 Tax=uncultured Campylobacter sp. TaxID=218934 RepID=UPI002626885E|nr:transcriptional regulator [uncultured Campylobacter sp.]
MRKNLSQRDIAGILKVDTKTLYNWRKNKPELYRIVMLGFKFDELLKQAQENLNELQNLAEENANLRLK